MHGLDPRMHGELQHLKFLWLLWRCLMDCRVKPGNDSA
jgi:hypothetical protein